MNKLWVALTDNMHYDNNFSHYCADVVDCIRSCSGGNESVADGSLSKHPTEIVTDEASDKCCSPLLSVVRKCFLIYYLFFGLMLSAFILNILLL